MTINQGERSASGERSREGAEKATEEETNRQKQKAGKQGGKDDTVLGDINDDAKKKRNE